MKQLIVNKIVWTWIKDYDNYNYRNTRLYSQTKKWFQKISLKITSLFVCLIITFESDNSFTANIQDFSQNFSITLSDPSYSGLIITISDFLILISYHYSFQTYTELLNMGKYDSVKYSKVEDLGAEDEPPNEQVKTSTTGKRLGKWTSVR